MTQSPNDIARNDIIRKFSSIEELDRKLLKLNSQLETTIRFAGDCRDAWSHEDLDELIRARDRLLEAWPDKSRAPGAPVSAL